MPNRTKNLDKMKREAIAQPGVREAAAVAQWFAGRKSSHAGDCEVYSFAGICTCGFYHHVQAIEGHPEQLSERYQQHQDNLYRAEVAGMKVHTSSVNVPSAAWTRKPSAKRTRKESRP